MEHTIGHDVFVRLNRSRIVIKKSDSSRSMRGDVGRATPNPNPRSVLYWTP